MKNHQLFSSFLGTSIGAFLLLQGCSYSENINANYNTDNAIKKAEPTTSVDPLSKFDKAKSAQLTDTAKLLAGIEVDSQSILAKVQKNQGWSSHKNYYKNAWSKLENQQLAKVRKWTATELKEINAKSPSVFYPFSGPDFLYSYSLFPQAKEMVLIGLEPVGSVPDFAKLSANESNTALSKARSSLSEILQFSFFRTNDMKVDLQKQGVLPILYIFMARTNNRILDLQYIGLDKSASIQQFKEGMVPGVKITFVPEGDSVPRNLYYFSTDLSNDGLKKHPELTKFVTKLENPVTYLKAASYLMYNDSFSNIRNTILAKSSHLLQDDSGMPLKSFDNGKWDLKFYGAYTRPIGLFSNSYQSDLRQVYVSNKAIKPLDFGIGYQFAVNQSNLMLAETKQLTSTKPK
ncbi:hypothetical protein IQ247_22920 [Plectonema cf. radiosum LEGE 06105]|uniref:Lipoprotein n=1 Tax=Plectonema cf. radiosum LEGE 06105 TaxID=945769 RepID=A0A8J7F3B6_9CYAN|nr:hypothetical protein [Plectonema radiosum]MBE9215481.1 hypothetical protein [Plectonema cf. radiosum LEGE 06105]